MILQGVVYDFALMILESKMETDAMKENLEKIHHNQMNSIRLSKGAKVNFDFQVKCHANR